MAKNKTFPDLAALIEAGELTITDSVIADVKNNVSFWFKQTGAKFVKDGRLYHIPRQLQHSQARKAGLNIE